jgi:hypothetical protein
MILSISFNEPGVTGRIKDFCVIEDDATTRCVTLWKDENVAGIDLEIFQKC